MPAICSRLAQRGALALKQSYQLEFILSLDETIHRLGRNPREDESQEEIHELSVSPWI
jgi:hypothetical protein